MMGLAAGAITALIGPLFRAVTLPALLFGMLFSAHQAVKARDARLLHEGERKCDAAWESQIRSEERAAAERDRAAARSLLETERQTGEEMRNEITLLNKELDSLRNRSADERCLSDGVLDTLKKGRKANTKPNHAKPQS